MLNVHRYDSHREQILRSGERHQAGGGSGFSGPQKPADEEDLFQYFSAACFSGYGDGPKASSAVTSVFGLHLFFVVSCAGMCMVA